MKYQPNESYDEWATRVSMYEKGRALQRIASGENIEEVMEEMSRRITDKLLHPIRKVITESGPKTTEAEMEESRQRYKAEMDKKGLTADQVDGQIFDKNQ
jgi:glutamyl-tRNA reductase